MDFRASKPKTMPEAVTQDSTPTTICTVLKQVSLPTFNLCNDPGK